MGNALNLDSFLAVGLQAQNYVFTHILVWDMLIQLIVVGGLYLLARSAAGTVRPWLRRLLARHPLVEHSLPHLTKVITTRLLPVGENNRSSLNVLKISTYCGLIFPKRGNVSVGLSLSALTINPSPGVFRTMPRARGASGALKKSDT